MKTHGVVVVAFVAAFLVTPIRTAHSNGLVRAALTARQAEVLDLVKVLRGPAPTLEQVVALEKNLPDVRFVLGSRRGGAKGAWDVAHGHKVERIETLTVSELVTIVNDPVRSGAARAAFAPPTYPSVLSRNIHDGSCRVPSFGSGQVVAETFNRLNSLQVLTDFDAALSRARVP